MPAVVLLPLASLNAAETPQPPGKPNVVVLPVDDSDHGDVACHGNPHVKTPNIDAFAGWKCPSGCWRMVGGGFQASSHSP
jgi:hypothetical protein